MNRKLDILVATMTGTALIVADEIVEICQEKSIITSIKGSIRSNHYHNEDWHYMYTLSGSYEYYYKPHNSKEKPKLEVFTVGEMVFTPPHEDHACFFLEDTTLLVASRMPRGNQETYEKDVRRIKLLDDNGNLINE